MPEENSIASSTLFAGKSIVLFPCPTLFLTCGATSSAAAASSPPQQSALPMYSSCLPPSLLNNTAVGVAASSNCVPMSSVQQSVFESLLVRHGCADLMVVGREETTSPACCAALITVGNSSLTAAAPQPPNHTNKSAADFLSTLTSLQRKGRRQVIVVTESIATAKRWNSRVGMVMTTSVSFDPPTYNTAAVRAASSSNAASAGNCNVSNSVDAVKVLRLLLTKLEENRSLAHRGQPYSTDRKIVNAITSDAALLSFLIPAISSTSTSTSLPPVVIVGHEWLSDCVSLRQLMSPTAAQQQCGGMAFRLLRPSVPPSLLYAYPIPQAGRSSPQQQQHQTTPSQQPSSTAARSLQPHQEPPPPQQALAARDAIAPPPLVSSSPGGARLTDSIVSSPQPFASAEGGAAVVKEGSSAKNESNMFRDDSHRSDDSDHLTTDGCLRGGDEEGREWKGEETSKSGGRGIGVGGGGGGLMGLLLGASSDHGTGDEIHPSSLAATVTPLSSEPQRRDVLSPAYSSSAAVAVALPHSAGSTSAAAVACCDWGTVWPPPFPMPPTGGGEGVGGLSDALPRSTFRDHVMKQCAFIENGGTVLRTPPQTSFAQGDYQHDQQQHAFMMDTRTRAADALSTPSLPTAPADMRGVRRRDGGGEPTPMALPRVSGPPLPPPPPPTRREEDLNGLCGGGTLRGGGTEGGFISIFFGGGDSNLKPRHRAPVNTPSSTSHCLVDVDADGDNDNVHLAASLAALGGAHHHTGMLTALSDDADDDCTEEATNALSNPQGGEVEWAPFNPIVTANAGKSNHQQKDSSGSSPHRLHPTPIVSHYANDRMKKQLAFIDRVKPFAVQKAPPHSLLRGVEGEGGDAFAPNNHGDHVADDAPLTGVGAIQLRPPNQCVGASSLPSDRAAKELLAAPNQHLLDELARLKDVYASTGDHWRSYAYNRAIGAIKRYKGGAIVTGEEVRNLVGIGEKLYLKIKEILATGTSAKLARLKASPEVMAIEAFTRVWGIGPSTARRLASMRGGGGGGGTALFASTGKVAEKVEPSPTPDASAGGGAGGQCGAAPNVAAAAAAANPYMRFITNSSANATSVATRPSATLGCGNATATTNSNTLLYRTIEDLRRRPPSFLSPSQLIGLAYLEDLEERIPRAEVEAIADIVCGALQRVGFAVNRRATDQRLMSSSSSSTSTSAKISSSTTTSTLSGSRHPLDVVVCGSYRRGKTSSGDVDVLICDPSGRRTDGILRLLIEELGKMGRSNNSSCDEHRESREKRRRRDDGIKAERNLKREEEDGAGASKGLTNEGGSIKRESVPPPSSSFGSSFSKSSANPSSARRPFVLAQLTSSYKSQKESSCDTWFGVVQIPNCVTDDHSAVTACPSCPCAHRSSGRVHRGEENEHGEGGRNSETKAVRMGPPPAAMGEEETDNDTILLTSYKSYHNLGHDAELNGGEGGGLVMHPPHPLLASLSGHQRPLSSSSSTHQCPFVLDSSDEDNDAVREDVTVAVKKEARVRQRSLLVDDEASGDANDAHDSHAAVPNSLLNPSSMPPPPSPPFLPPVTAYNEGKHFARRLDIKVYPAEQLPFAVLYFTGSDYFNRSMRLYCHKRGLSLSDHGLVHVIRDVKTREAIHEGDTIYCATERDIFDAIGLPYRYPHERDL